jgi:cytochrome bd ubiquinol oxidase subunit II
VTPFSNLNTAWFALIGLLWAGFFFLEGFDFGVGVVSPFLARDETDRRICLNAIGPVWDGNEVWLLVAGGATFAAFPLWYARLFSGFYLALFLLLVGLIVRGVSFEFRGKDERLWWRRLWDAANFVGSLVPPVVLGAAFTDLVHGLPLSPGGRYYGGLIGLLHPVALLGGLTALALFCFHGSVFLALKTGGDLAAKARRAATAIGALAAVLLAGLIGWLATAGPSPRAGSLAGWIPLAMAVAAVAAVASGVVARMFPAVLPASNGAGNGLTIGEAASQHYTLVVMSVVAAIFTPLVLAYQGWTYWVFRKRLVRPVEQPHASS